MVKDGDTHMQPCAQCAKPITEEDETLECFGHCRLEIHTNCLPGATAVEIDQLRKIHNAVFVCDACYALHGYEYDAGHCNKTLDEIVNKLNDLACVVELVKNFEQKVRKIVKSELVKNNSSVTVQKDNKEQNGRVLRSETKKNKPETPVSNNGRGKQKAAKPPDEAEPTAPKQYKKPEPVIVIKPKQGTEAGSTREELKKKVNPKNLNVSRVIQGKDGAVMVVLKDEGSSKQLKESVKKAMGDKFDVSVRESIKPTIKIVGMNEEYAEEELQETLVSQNDVFQGLKHFKLRKFLSNPRREYAQYSAIVELDAATFFKVMELEKLNVGWDRCRVFDGVDVLRCFKCCGFNHKGADCKVRYARFAAKIIA